jgi:hypothetical protein
MTEYLAGMCGQVTRVVLKGLRGVPMTPAMRACYRRGKPAAKPGRWKRRRFRPRTGPG